MQDHDGHMQIHTKHSISSSRQRPYHVENTASRPISEVKQRRVWSVLGWVTAWEHQMLLAFFFNELMCSAIFLLRIFVFTWIFLLTYGCVIQIEWGLTVIMKNWSWLVVKKNLNNFVEKCQTRYNEKKYTWKLIIILILKKKNRFWKLLGLIIDTAFYLLICNDIIVSRIPVCSQIILCQDTHTHRKKVMVRQGGFIY